MYYDVLRNLYAQRLNRLNKTITYVMMENTTHARIEFEVSVLRTLCGVWMHMYTYVLFQDPVCYLKMEMCVYMYVCTYVCMYVYMYTHTHVYIHTIYPCHPLKPRMSYKICAEYTTNTQQFAFKLIPKRLKSSTARALRGMFESGK